MVTFCHQYTRWIEPRSMPLPPEQLSKLVQKQWGPLVAWLGPASWTEDVVQEAFIRLAAVDPPPDRPIAWLFRVARNLSLNESKANVRRQRRHAKASIDPPAANWDSAETEEVVRFLNQLPSEQREVIVARLWGDLSFAEIAETLGRSPATVWRTFQTALDQLRTLYGLPTAEATSAVSMKNK